MTQKKFELFTPGWHFLHIPASSAFFQSFCRQVPLIFSATGIEDRNVVGTGHPVLIRCRWRMNQKYTHEERGYAYPAEAKFIVSLLDTSVIYLFQ